MGEKKWVQHISVTGRKYEVVGESEREWRVLSDKDGLWHYLPHDEYIPCDPPEEWEDVTGDVDYKPEDATSLSYKGSPVNRKNYRFRKVRCAKATGFENPDWAFIVERRKS